MFAADKLKIEGKPGVRPNFFVEQKKINIFVCYYASTGNYNIHDADNASLLISFRDWLSGLLHY